MELSLSLKTPLFLLAAASGKFSDIFYLIFVLHNSYTETMSCTVNYHSTPEATICLSQE